MSQMRHNGRYTESPHGSRRPWTRDEDETIWAHPQWTASELAQALPDRTVDAIRRHRDRIGRWRPGTVPLCQKCGEHPVWEEAADAARWGLCKSCAMDEREWRLRHRTELERRSNALRQAAFKARRRAGKGPDGGDGA